MGLPGGWCSFSLAWLVELEETPHLSPPWWGALLRGVQRMLRKEGPKWRLRVFGALLRFHLGECLVEQMLSWSVSWGCAQEFEDWRLALGRRKEVQTQLTVRGGMKGKDSQ